MKICYTCKLNLADEYFSKNKRHKDGLQSTCKYCQKEYHKQHYNKNQKKYVKKAKDWTNNLREKWKAYKKQFKCSRCPENNPVCIDFHHTDDNKEGEISRLVLSNWDKAMEEIKKCIPLCSNCHRKEHA